MTRARLARVVIALGLAWGAGCERTPLTAELGGPCARLSECARRCLPPPEWPGGFCTLPCTGDAACGSEASCVDADGSAACLFSCYDDDDCNLLETDTRDGWRCRALPAAGTGVPVRVCAP